MPEIIKKFLKKIFPRPIDIKKSWVEEPSRHSTLAAFLNWFDKTSSVEDTKQKAASDWKNLIVNFSEYPGLNKNNCLEIGFGGGRLLVPASRDFAKIYGVDIHNSFNKTSEYLALNKVSNYQLLNREKLKDLPDHSINFIFTYIVFQHFDSFAEVNYYLEEIKRLLAPGGYCHIFYAKSDKEEIKEVNPRVFEKRRRSLFINPEFFWKHLSDKGFNIVSYADILPDDPERPRIKYDKKSQAKILFQLK
jgi:ubiquinone/menaquinone biosynthesis C-methylase UbiE